MYDDNKWWKAPKGKVHTIIFPYIKYIEQNQQYRQTANFKYMRLYGNFELAGLNQYNFTPNQDILGVRNRVTFNIVQSMVDTVTSKITKNKPKPTFLTDGGDFTLQQKAKKLNKFAEGQLQSTDYYAKSAIAFKDSTIFGTGAIKIFRDGTDIKCERVFIDEIIIDDSESFYSTPRQMHQRKYIHKDVLKAMFPKHASAIDQACENPVIETYQSSRPKQTDMVLVIESWHLPSGKDSKDGKRSICISNETLLEEEWKKDYFPFVFHRWNLRQLGFFGQGIAEQLEGLQIEINKILKTIQISMHLISIPKILVENASKIVSAHINNKIGGIIKYTGQPPIPANMGSIPPDLFAHLDRLYTRAYEIVGVSSLSAQSAKPSGLDSGKALREFNDIETERFMEVGIRYENTYLQACRMMIDLGKEIAEDAGEFNVQVKGKRFLETINWDEVDMPEDKYSMHIFPTSSLSSTPAGRLQDVQELMQAGFIGREEGMKLLDFPDLEAFNNFANAGVEDIDNMIEMMIDKGEYQSPEPYQNLALGITKMQQAYLYYRTQKAPEERLELLRRWIEDANVLLQRAANQDAVEQEQMMADAQVQAEEQAAIDNAAAVTEASDAGIPV